MKESKYNFYISDKQRNICLIYNALKNNLVRDDDSKLQNLIRKCKGNIEFDPEYLTKDEYNEFLSLGFIVSNETDEKQSAIDINKKRLEILTKKCDKLVLVITPTLQCNFKCYYCFESNNIRKNEEVISMRVQNDIINFISKSITKNNIKEVEIIWYGGEPLIQQHIIFSMQNKINTLCKLYDVKISSDIVTNGILLTPETCELLLESGIKKVQVTIDGPETIHNQRRHYPTDPNNNYQIILENILSANDNVRFLIRINIDRKNEKYIFDLLDDIIKRKIWPYKKNVSIYTAQVMSNTKISLSNKAYSILEDNVRTYLSNKYNEIKQTNSAKLKFLYPKFGGGKGCGYGIYKNSWVISYNGDVFRCWESVGKNEQAVCTIKDLLGDFGNSIFEKIKIDNHSFEQWGCFDCKYFPICASKCPWEFLNSNNNDRRCTSWKSTLEYRLLNQYKQFLEKPEIFVDAPFEIKQIKY